MNLRNQKGQGLIEYVLLVALIGVATTLMVRKLQSAINVNMAHVIEGLQSSDRPKHHSFIRVEDRDVKMKDFSNFMNGTADRSDENQ
jgi:Flp pilus assembly pilin Flp